MAGDLKASGCFAVEVIVPAARSSFREAAAGEAVFPQVRLEKPDDFGVRGRTRPVQQLEQVLFLLGRPGGERLKVTKGRHDRLDSDGSPTQAIAANNRFISICHYNSALLS